MAKKRAADMAKRSAGKAKNEPAFSAPAETQKMLSVRLPADRHKLLKRAALDNDIPIRSLLLAMIDEIEADSIAGRALIHSAIAAEDD